MNSFKRILLIVLSFVSTLAAAEPVQDLSDGRTGRIEFMSSTPISRWRMANPKFAEQNPTVVWGDLLMPNENQMLLPAVIIHHGSEGLHKTYREVWAKAFLDHGYAVFVVDSQTPRGVQGSLGGQQLTWNTTGNISDALHALKLLASHPRIDNSRIFNIGFSRGANAVLSAAWPFYQSAVLPPGLNFAATAVLYPGCNVRYQESQWGKNPGPLLFLLGEKDDMTPSQPCVEFAEELKAQGNDVQYKVYPDAYHSFDRLDQPMRRFWEGTFADCSITLKMSIKSGEPFEAVDYKTGQKYGTYAAWESAVKACGRDKQITVSSNSKVREQAVADTLQFFAASSNRQK